MFLSKFTLCDDVRPVGSFLLIFRESFAFGLVVQSDVARRKIGRGPCFLKKTRKGEESYVVSSVERRFGLGRDDRLWQESKDMERYDVGKRKG